MFLLDYFFFFFLLFVHIYITSIKLSKFKMPKVHHSHQNKGEKKSCPQVPQLSFMGFLLDFFRFLACLFAVMSSSLL